MCDNTDFIEAERDHFAQVARDTFAELKSVTAERDDYIARLTNAEDGVPMPNQPRKDNPARSVRVPDDLWEAAKRRAAERGETVTDPIIRALRRYVR